MLLPFLVIRVRILGAGKLTSFFTTSSVVVVMMVVSRSFMSKLRLFLRRLLYFSRLALDLFAFRFRLMLLILTILFVMLV